MISAPHIHKTQNFENKLQKFIHEGLSRLQVITDFDNTLTYGFINGTRGHTTFGFLRESGYLDENYGEKSDALFWKYYTMWKDDSVEYEYKMKQMKNWIYEHGELLRDTNQ